MRPRADRRANAERGILLAVFAALALAACGDENPFRSTSPQVFEGENQVWELGLPAFPSGWDFASAQRIFVGTDDIGGSTGAFLLDARTDGTLAFRPFSTFLAPGLSGVRTGIQDLGAVPYESVEEVPEGGYSDVNDSAGVAVQQGHVYAFRITRSQGGIVPINYAKLGVIEVGTEFPGEPASRFARFRWAYQVQPLNRRVVE
ncbi:MAG: hypothetical protein ACREK2_05650 [Gemmatimonadota bacterium]